MTQDLELQPRRQSLPVRDPDGVGGLRPIDIFRLIDAARPACRNRARAARRVLRTCYVYRDCSNRLLGSRGRMRSALILILATRGRQPVNVRAELETERVGVFLPPLAYT